MSTTSSKWAVLAITDGSTTVGGRLKEVSLLKGGLPGFQLTEWKPKIIKPKNGGVYQDSPTASFRRLVYAADEAATESMSVMVNQYNQNLLIEEAQELMRLLLKARAYWLTEWQDEPVYIRARSQNEDNERFAVIYNFNIPELDDPYNDPFYSAQALAVMDNITLELERGHWLANAPGTGTAVEVSSQQEWYDIQWVVISTLPNNYVYSFLQTTTGRILAGDYGQILYSDNDGATWAVLTTSPVDSVHSFLQTTTGRILAGENGQIWYSDNNGTTWAVLTTSPAGFVYSFLQTTTGRILAGESGQIWYSDNNGATWNTTGLFTGGAINGLVQLSNGTILAGSTEILSSTDGVTWSILASTYYMSYCLKVVGLSRILSGDSSNIRYSDDNGETWKNAFIAGGSPTGFFSLLLLTDGTILAGNENSDIFVSTDNGETWVRETDYPTGEVRSLFLTSGGKVLVGENGQMLKRVKTIIDLGVENTSLNSPYIVNQFRYANITHIYVSDGGVFGSNLLTTTTFPIQLYPTSPAVDDAIYFISKTSSFNSGRFDSLIFDLSSNINYTSSYTITWEYYNGSAWATLSVQDGTNSFKFKGVNSVHWSRPSSWGTTTVNGVTGYAVRARISALSGTITAPAQQNRSIYAIANPYIDIDEGQVKGDIQAYSRIKVHNRSDIDGPSGSVPDLYSNRIVAGLKSGVSGFSAFINLSDSQLFPGIIVKPWDTYVSFSYSAIAPTGRYITVVRGTGSMSTKARITLAPSTALSFYGTFHAFLRGHRDAGVATDITVRLQVSTGSGGVTFTTQSRQFKTTTAFEVLDFGEISLPVSSSFKSSDLGDVTTINIQADIIDGAAGNLYLYDLILIPVDEWAVDAVDFSNTSLSEVGRSGSIPKFLDINSIDPGTDIKTLVRTTDSSEFITSEYNPITNGPAMLQANADQRLWFFCMQTTATGSSYNWIAPPEISHSVQVWATARYLGLRGER